MARTPIKSPTGNPYVDVQISPEKLRHIRPVEIFSKNGYKGELGKDQRLYDNQGPAGLGLECRGCGQRDGPVSFGYRGEDILANLPEDVAQSIGRKGLEKNVIPCSHCGKILDSYEPVSSWEDEEDAA